MLINIEVGAIKSEVILNYLLTSREKKLGSTQEIKFHDPEEDKRRVQKKIYQEDRIKKIVMDVNSKSR